MSAEASGEEKGARLVMALFVLGLLATVVLIVVAIVMPTPPSSERPASAVGQESRPATDTASPPAPSHRVANIDDSTLERFLRERVGGPGSIVSIVAKTDVSEGTTNKQPARVIQVKYSVEVNGLVLKECSFFHYSYDSEFKTFEQIAFSDASTTCSPNDKLFGGYGKTFAQEMQEIGYSGSLPAH